MLRTNGIYPGFKCLDRRKEHHPPHSNGGMGSKILVVCAVIALYTAPASCCKGRNVLTDRTGYITDGYADYPDFARCEWLIDAGGAHKSIRLEFEYAKQYSTPLNTECSYDFLFIFDGNSYNSKLLASLSGNSLPGPIIARSGHMLIYLFSDRNYNLSGFHAKYIIQDCPSDCNGHGVCNNHTCICDTNHTGTACEIEYCPKVDDDDVDGCGNHGVCVVKEDFKGCVCSEGYSGYSCNISLDDAAGSKVWRTLSSDNMGFTSRAAHAGVFLSSTECLYIFGGYTLNHVLGDLVKFCMKENRWQTVDRSETDPWPAARMEHAIAEFKDGFYIFGGILEDRSFSNELWYYNATSSLWTLNAVNSTLKPLPLSGHSLTRAENSIYVVGGKTVDGTFQSNIYNIDASLPESWTEVHVLGGKTSLRRLVGHSTVYHKESKSLLVYAGYTYTDEQPRFGTRVNKLHAFHTEDRIWSEIHFDKAERFKLSPMKRPKAPIERAFHSAVIIGNYMVVYGGNAHQHHKNEICYDYELYMYHLGCHVWVPYRYVTEIYSGLFYPKPGRVGHVAAVAYNNMLLIAGGYSGYMRGDLLAFKFPTLIALPESMSGEEFDFCENYTHQEKCQYNPECLFCNARNNISFPGCVHISKAHVCERNPHTLKSLERTECPGLCSALSTCQECTSQGQGPSLSSSSVKPRLFIEQCSWCVKEAQCQKTADPEGTCESEAQTGSGVVGWWNGKSASLNQTDQCHLEDFPAGLHSVKYRHPMNESQPDKVEIIRRTHQDKFFEHIFSNNGEHGHYMKWFGWVYPLNASVKQSHRYVLTLKAQNTSTQLNISVDKTVKNQEIVANISKSAMTQIIQVKRSSGDPIFPRRGRGSKYYINLDGKYPYPVASSGITTTTVISSVDLQWNGGIIDFDRFSQNINYEFLEPFHLGSCGNHDNCMACLTDSFCGWCGPDTACVNRVNTTQSSCTGDLKEQLVTSPEFCPGCSDHINCDACAKDNHCEWILSHASCIRRGRVSSMVIRDQSKCPASCHSRKICGDCIQEKKCAWCENLQSCLPFSDYVTRHLYGQCKEWIDNEDSSNNPHVCRNCSMYTECSKCLQSFNCGWCGSTDNPLKGQCVAGDFAGPFGNVSCMSMVNETYTLSANDTTDWSYAECPDVDECRLGLHNCHENATCENSPLSFSCRCNRGFLGDGVSECVKTCYHECMHGTCSGAPDYLCQCDVGWTGDNCSIDCQCNQHSTCTMGVGKCDDCQNGTTGQFCERCLVGYFGVPSEPPGCYRCKCNGHGDPARGECHNATGECFCIDNTHGFDCQHCLPGYYGNPKAFGKCYLNCDDGMILKNISHGALGTSAGSGVTTWRAHCMWILTMFRELEDQHRNYPLSITVTIEDIAVECDRDYVYVYDGIPKFIHGGSESHSVLLGAFCGFHRNEELSVTAASGILTIYFSAEVNNRSVSQSVGFNASYHVNKCRDDCYSNNQVCRGDSCQCITGYESPECHRRVCPENCTYDEDSVSCHCLSESGWAPYSISVFPWDFMLIPQTTGPIDAGQRNRYGHTLVSCDEDLLYLFGGMSLEHGLMSDIWQFNVTTKQWAEIKPITDDQPTGRYYHAAACVQVLKTIYVFGGFVESHDSHSYRASNELWKFATGTRKWTKLAVPTSVPGLAGHTLTLVEDTKLIVIGGFSTERFFSDTVYEYDTTKMYIMAWETYRPSTMSGAIPTGIYGHSAVYHQNKHNTKTIYVYGGHLFNYWKPFVSHLLYAFDVEEKTWNILQPEEWSQLETRYFHTAVGMKDYMVIIGGRNHHKNFSASILVYRYTCNFWHMINITGSAIGKSLTSLSSLSSAVNKESIYIVGGFNSLTHSEVYELKMPSDICSMVTDWRTCLNYPGCSACIAQSVTGENSTFCYSNNKSVPTSCLKSPIAEMKGEECSNLSWHKQRDCDKITNCSQCVAIYPEFKSAEPVCVWCGPGSCSVGQCVKRVAGAESNTQDMISSASKCSEHRCAASTCDRCKERGGCTWTRLIERKSEALRNVASKPKYDWSCFHDGSLKVLGDRAELMNTTTCPAPCYVHKNCTECLDSHGSEGGAQECIWSDSLHECMAPAYLSLHCSGGECGTVIQGSSQKCPRPCWDNTMCAECRRAPGCGWCAFGGLNGMGVCMEGSLTGPTEGLCVEHNVTYGIAPLSSNSSKLLSESTAPPTWNFAMCPTEDECSNGHHNCDPNTQNCKDKIDGFACECKEGYILKEEEQKCEPVCHQGCQRGHCIYPDKCKCFFGWVGNNCSTKCECNEHSNCKSVEEKSTCIQCMNNTQGRHCEECKPLFVGNPRDGGRCQSCTEFCHNHSDICLSTEYRDSQFKQIHQIMYSFNDTRDPSFIEMVSKLLERGPMNADSTLCQYCQHNTEGIRCETCESGYFRLPPAPLPTSNCTKCMCNGHSDTCDKDGLNCNCRNNSETTCDSQKGEIPCYQKQCASCKEYFLGTPTRGHQCYRQMTVKRDYCFDPGTQEECNRRPDPLRNKRTVFFVVQPKYVNVDIRVTVDVTEGGMDVYFAPSDEIFVVSVDKRTGVHSVALDPSIRDFESFPARKRRHIQKRDNNSNATRSLIYMLEEVKAQGINTFININEPGKILIVRDVKYRLAITLTNKDLDLRTSRFFMTLISTSDKTFGNLYFRQDQPHIDLFVFFSVFFSCFFLFLAMCVLLWKTKQAFDARRNRQQREREMMHMASRPFAQVLILIDHSVQSCVQTFRYTRGVKSHQRTPLLPSETYLPLSPVHKESSLDVVPIAIEPLDDGIAAIGTVVFQLPGGSVAPSQLCLGSALTMRLQFGALTLKARRRPSATPC